MTRITIGYEGSYHCKATHEPSGSELLTDLPPDNGGKGEFFSPTDLTATSLGSCILTIMAKTAERLDVDFSGVRIAVDKEMAPNPERRIKSLKTVIEMPKSLTEKERKVLERAAMTCPMHRTLKDSVDISVEFR